MSSHRTPLIYKILYDWQIKSIEFVGGSLDDLRAFPVSARRELGYQLDRLQHGLEPEDRKPMTGLGAGVREIRVRDQSGA